MAKSKKLKVIQPLPHIVTRRDLLRRGVPTVVLAGAAAGVAYRIYDPKGDAGLQRPEPTRLKDYFAEVDFPSASPRLAVAYGRPDQVEQARHVEELVTKSVRALHPDGMGGFISRGDVVLIKPNVGFDRGPKLGATTNPHMIGATVRLCREAGASKVIVADNPIESPAACFAKSGIKDIAEAAGASVLIHSNSLDAPVEIRPTAPDPDKGESLGVWPVFWKPLREADKVIGLPVIKHHNLCHASMSLKNWYGLLGGRRNQFHQAIHNIISDLGFMMKPTLIIADGTRVMMQNGPTGGRVDDISIGGVAGRPTVVASVDQLACDSWCCEKLLGRDPASLAYLDLAFEKFGNDPSRIVRRSWKEYDNEGKIAEVNV